jgi:nucleotide-binding universal stress UspA family protein
MFSRIVVGTDGSSTAKGAVDLAVGLAKDYGATLHLVNAYQQSNTAVSMAAAAGTVGAASLTSSHDARAFAESVLEAAADQLRAEGLQLELHAVPGPAADAIVGVAETVDADVIVVGNRGMKGARRILGSVPNSVAHGAPCTVIVAKTC